MFPDWLTYQRRRVQSAASQTPAPRVPASPPDPETPDTAAVQALATGVEQLCFLCEDLLGLISRTDAPDAVHSLMHVIPEQIEAVRSCAGEIKYRQTVGQSVPGDPYSLSSLGQWVWRE